MIICVHMLLCLIGMDLSFRVQLCEGIYSTEVGKWKMGNAGADTVFRKGRGLGNC